MTGVAGALSRGVEPGRGPGLGLRLRVFMHRLALDRELAAGAAQTSPELRLRTRQLTAAQSRAVLASCIDHVLDAAEEPPTTFSAPARVSRNEALDAEPGLRRMAELLRQGRGGVRGVAMASVLIRDGASPLYEPAARHSLAQDVRAAAEALEGDR